MGSDVTNQGMKQTVPFHASGGAPRLAFSDAVRAKSEGRVRSYVQSREDWNVHRSLKELVQQAIRDYEHRAVLELVQNAHDAHADGKRDGRILILLDSDEGAHGVLYVANAGRCFSSSNFDAICDVAQSDKRPDEGIGNKGIGFKSALQLCRSPEIYSQSPKGEAEGEIFGGFCFRFATDDDFIELARSDAQLAADLERDIFHLCLPMPIAEPPVSLQAFADQGYATVIRLCLKSAEALGEAQAELRALELEPPPLLFLRRIRTLAIEERLDGKTTSRIHERLETPMTSPDELLTCAKVELATGSYAVLERNVGAAEFKASIDRSVAGDRMSDKWLNWTGDVKVSVAVPLDGTPIDGRLYAFLPMGEHATAPLGAHVNAPFFSKLARVDLEETVPLNDLLMNEVADLCAAGALFIAGALIDLPRFVAVDLICWRGPGHGRIVRAFERCNSPLPMAPVVPASQPKEAWTNLTGARSWTDLDRQVLTSEFIHRSTGAPIVDASLGDQRLARLHQLADMVLGRTLEPSVDELVRWAELAARLLVKQPFTSATWEGFYDDLASAIPNREWSRLRGSRILIDDYGRVQRTLSQSNPRAPVPFFSPRSEDSELDNPDVDLRPPSTLKRRIYFVHQALRWNLRSGQGNVKRPGRRLLDSGLVNEYRASDLFPVIGRSLQSSHSVALYADVLRWVYRLARSRADPPWAEIRDVGLRVPLKTGNWTAARGAQFSSAWGDARDQLLEELIDRAADSSPELVACGERFIVGPDAWPFDPGDRSFLKEFLRHIGVQSGLSPQAIPDSQLELNGSRFEDLSAASSVRNLTDPSRALWTEALRLDQPTGLRPYTTYSADGQLFILPGQDDFAGLSEDAQRRYSLLIAHGIESWDDRCLRVTIRRHNDRNDAFTWPTPVEAFLRAASWVPMGSPGERGKWYFVAPADAWTHGASDEAPPSFVPLVPAVVRRLWDGGDRVAQRLGALGVRYWDDPTSGAERVRTLGAMLADDSIPDAAVVSFKKAYEEAWGDVVDTSGEDPFTGHQGGHLVVTRGGRLFVLPVEDQPDAEPVYVQDGDQAQALRLLEQRGAALLRLRTRQGAAVAEILAPRFGSRLRRLSASRVTVRVDGQDFIPGSMGAQLINADNAWLVDLIAAVVELRTSQFRRVSPESLRRAVDRARRIMIVFASDLEALVDDVVVEPLRTGRRVLAVPSVDAPSIVVESSEPVDNASLIELVAPAVAELVGYPDLADALRVALIDIQRQGTSTPDSAVIARALGETSDRLKEIKDSLRQPAEELVRALVPILAVYDIDAARAIWQAVDGLVDTNAVEVWLSNRTAANPLEVGVARLISVCAEADLNQARLALAIDLRVLNAAIVAVGLPFQPLQNREGIEREFRFYLAQNRENLLNSLRIGFVGAFRDEESLTAYVAARDLHSIEPDERWADEFIELPREAIEARVSDWLASVGGSRHSAVQLPQLEEVRTLNRGQVNEVAEQAADLLFAWERHHSREASCRPPAPADAAELAMQAGVLDFEPLATDRVLRWLGRNGYWPPELAATLQPEAHGLTAEAVREAKRLRLDALLDKDRARRQIQIDGKPFSATRENYPGLVQAIRDSISPAFTATGAVLARLAAQPAIKVRERRSSSRRVTAARRPSLSPEQIEAVGLAGEVAALEWLKVQYESASEDSWRSGYRNQVIGDGLGDDSLGYDFEVITAKQRLLFEVKAAIGDGTEFDLTGAEIQAAQSVRRSERFYILFIQHVLDADERRALMLPNPFSPEGSDYFGTVGAGLRLRFSLV